MGSIDASSVKILSGKCLCGGVRYEVEDQFRYSLNCHCSNCRRTTGSAFKPFAGLSAVGLELPMERTACLFLESNRDMTLTAASVDRCSIRSCGRPRSYTLRWARWLIRRRFAPPPTSSWDPRHRGTRSRMTYRSTKSFHNASAVSEVSLQPPVAAGAAAAEVNWSRRWDQTAAAWARAADSCRMRLRPVPS